MPKEPLVPKAPRQPRLDPQIEVSGEGRFKLPGSFEWHDIKGTSWIPRESRVTFTGAGGAVDGLAIGPGRLYEIPSKEPMKMTPPEEKLRFTPAKAKPKKRGTETVFVPYPSTKPNPKKRKGDFF